MQKVCKKDQSCCRREKRKWREKKEITPVGPPISNIKGSSATQKVKNECMDSKCRLPKEPLSIAVNSNFQNMRTICYMSTVLLLTLAVHAVSSHDPNKMTSYQVISMVPPADVFQIDIASTRGSLDETLSLTDMHAALDKRGGGLIPAGYHPLGYKITPLGERFLEFGPTCLESDVGRLLASIKTKRKTMSVIQTQWLEIVRVSKTGQSMRIYRTLQDLIDFCLAARLID